MTSIFADIRNAFRHPNALYQLILINVIVFVVLIIARTILFFAGYSDFFGVIMDYIALPANFSRLLTRPWTLFSYFFTHREFFHILFNMLNLYWFGMLIREYLGDRKLVSLYILGGLMGGVFFLLLYNFYPNFRYQINLPPLIGASASTLAITVAAATLLPNYTFNLLFIGPVKIKWIAAGLLVISFAGIPGGNIGGNVAHLGGALLGFLFIKQLQRGTDLGRPVQAVGTFFRNLFKARSPLKVTYSNPKKTSVFSSSAPGEPSQTEIDIILDKISRSGYESLSKEEKQKLFRASQKKDE